MVELAGRLVQAHACPPKQRIRVPPERADKRADSPALDQPATAIARQPGASSDQDRGGIARRSAHRTC